MSKDRDDDAPDIDPERVREKFVDTDDSHVKTWDTWEEYVAWCKDRGLDPGPRPKKKGEA